MSSHPSVLFVCLHGSAKSLIAAEHFRRLASERGRLLNSASAGVDPDAEVPPFVVAGLHADGFNVAGRRPHRVTHEAVREADLVVSFGCELDAGLLARPTAQPVVRWDDIPAVSEGYDAARDEIVRRLIPLLDKLD